MTGYPQFLRLYLQNEGIIPQLLISCQGPHVCSNIETHTIKAKSYQRGIYIIMIGFQLIIADSKPDMTGIKLGPARVAHECSSN